MNNTIDQLEALGIDYKDGLKRFVGNSNLYHRMLLTFSYDKEIFLAEESLNNNDYEQVFAHLHSLKGITGNLSITTLYQTVSFSVDKIRYKDYSTIKEDIEKIKTMFNDYASKVQKILE